MKHDQETYVRARNAAIIGLVIQFVLSVGVAILGLWTRSPALTSVGWYLFGGLPVWFVLILIYNQHRLERVEALEKERLGDVGGDSALFGGGADDLDLARRRLAGLYKWGLNGVSIFVSMFLLGVGSWLLVKYLDLFSEILEGETEKGVTWGRLIANGLSRDGVESVWEWLSVVFGITLVSFVGSRYHAGMTKVSAWGLLRGGASYLMGVTVMMGLVCLGGLGVVFGESGLMGVLGLVIPGLMILLGLEMGLVHFLSVYRPRKEGEFSRPGFDSRLLGWLTSPESLSDVVHRTINYQFGVEVSRSWFFRVLGRAILPLMLFMGFVLMLSTCWVSVEKHEQALILEYGGLTAYEGDNYVYPAGVHFKLPWPLGVAYKYDTGRVQIVNVRTSEGDLDRGLESKPILWNVAHGGGMERYFITGPARVEGGSKSKFNFALVGGRVEVQYKVDDLVKYVGVARSDYARKLLIGDLCEREVTHYFMSKDIDMLLGVGQGRAGDDLKLLIQDEFDRLGLGVRVLFVGLTGVHPPMDDDVAKTYLKQNSSRYEAASELEKAKQYASAKLSAVSGNEVHGMATADAILELEKMMLRRGKGEGGEALHRAIGLKEVEIEKMLTGELCRVKSMIGAARTDRWVFPIDETIKLERLVAEKPLYDAVPMYFREMAKFRALMRVFKSPRSKLIGDFADVTYRLDEKDVGGGVGIGSELSE